MSTVEFLAGWGLRSSILIACGVLLLAAFRVKAASVRLLVWTVILSGSMALPGLNVFEPRLQIAVPTPAPIQSVVPAARVVAPPVAASSGSSQALVSRAPASSFDWTRVPLIVYLGMVVRLLLRLCIGLVAGSRLRGRSRMTDRGFSESDAVTTPITVGIFWPTIVLPPDWREWEAAKLDVVLAHEGSHIRRWDPAVQFVSAIHRAILWFSPLSWYLHQRLVRAAEEVSDDDAVAVIRDRALYAEVLLGFMQRAGQGQRLPGLAMARYDLPEKRIHRILDAATCAHGLTRWSIAGILALGCSLAYVVAAVKPAAVPLPQVVRTPVLTMPIQIAQAKPSPARPLPAPSRAPAKPVETNDALVVMAIDRSASMETGRKMELARAAVTSVVDSLRAEDRVGVLTFNQFFEWVVPIRVANDKPALTQFIAGMYPDGGTTIPPALAEAYNKALAYDVRYRHVLLLTDGISEEGDSVEVAKSALEHKITISTIGLGLDVRREFLEKIAAGAGGKSYFLTEPTGLQQIMLKDVQEFTGRSVETGSNGRPRYEPNADAIQELKGLLANYQAELGGKR